MDNKTMSEKISWRLPKNANTAKSTRIGSNIRFEPGDQLKMGNEWKKDAKYS